MDNKTLLKLTGRYLDDYLEAFLESGQSSDLKSFLFGQPVPPSQARFNPDVESVDLHKKRFDMIHDTLPDAKLKGFVDTVSSMEDVVVVDMCSWYGERFGLWVAAANPSAEVHVYDPQVLQDFAPFLFNDQKPECIFKFDNQTPYDVMHQEQSVNNLYRQNGLGNITFHQQVMCAAGMKRIACRNKGRKVVFTARRINDLVGPVADAVATCENAEMVIAPLVNLEVKNYQDDTVMRLIDRRRDIRRDQDSSVPVAPADNARSRLFTMMQKYYSLKAASVVGDRAEVYRSGDLDGLSVFHHPTHYVSTIEPKRK